MHPILRLSLRELVRLGEGERQVLIVHRRAILEEAFRELGMSGVSGGADAPLESLLRRIASLDVKLRPPTNTLARCVMEKLRFDLVSGNTLSQLNVHVAAIVHDAVQQASALCMEKNGEWPSVEEATGIDTVTADCAPSLLHFCVAEMAKNSFVHGVSQPPSVHIDLVSSDNAIVLSISNKGVLGITPAWFSSTVTQRDEQSTYVNGSMHGNSASGYGTGVMMTQCAMNAMGNTLHVQQELDQVVSKMVIWRHGHRKCV
jgi:hypothetical protein